jgi:hypothetical protein
MSCGHPLHGMLASAELLTANDLQPAQYDIVKMVETCGLTLLDTMNHMYVSAATFNMPFANERCTA